MDKEETANFTPLEKVTDFNRRSSLKANGGLKPSSAQTVRERSSLTGFIKAKSAVFRLLKIRSRSEQEVKDKLKQKGFDEHVIGQAIRYFKDLELIHDRQFAKGWIASRLNKPFGSHRIRLELKQKGIDDDIIDEELTKALESYSEEEVVLSLLKKRVVKYKNVPPLKLKQRLYNYLARRGFNAEVIYRSLKRYDS